MQEVKKEDKGKDEGKLLYEQLSKPFPQEVLTIDKSRGFPLNSIPAYFVIERLNKVLGLCGMGWGYKETEQKREENEIVSRGEFWFKIENKSYSLQCEGGKDIIHDHLTDAMKSARTNAICKGASFIGVGIQVYQGQEKAITQTTAPRTTPNADHQTPRTTPNADHQTPSTTKGAELLTAPQRHYLNTIVWQSKLVNDSERDELDEKVKNLKSKGEAYELVKYWKEELPKKADLEAQRQANERDKNDEITKEEEVIEEDEEEHPAATQYYLDIARINFGKGYATYNQIYAILENKGKYPNGQWDKIMKQLKRGMDYETARKWLAQLNGETE